MLDEEGKPPLSVDDKRKCAVGKSFSESFKAVIDKATDFGNKHVRVALFTHRCPDPDAMGSMMGLSWLLFRYFNIESDMFYDGEISHPQNKTICNLLDPQLRPVKEYRDEYGLRMLVDTIPSNAGVGEHKNVDFDVVIDHHKELPNGGFSGLCIHMKTGACCSIIYKLMRYLVRDNIWFEDDNDADSKVATAMISGIVNDTEYMVSDDTTECEFEAYAALFPFRNPSFLKQIAFFKRPKFWVETKANAATSAEINEEGYAIVGLGLIPEKDRDLVSDMAEEMITWAGVTTAVAFAVVGGERIEGSVRSLNASISVSDFCKKLGSRHGNGGGKLGKGAYKYALAGMSIDPEEEDEIKNETWKTIKLKETNRIMRMIRK